MAKTGAPEGTCVVAERQLAGRGREGRSWHSDAGSGLYLSILLRPDIDTRIFPILTLVCAVALHDSISQISGARPDIKWPNDILVGEKKICGMLAETCDTPTGPAVVMGIGVNLATNTLPPEIKENATSISDQTGNEVDFDMVLRSVLDHIVSRYVDFTRTADVPGILNDWSSRSSYYSGKMVTVRSGNETIKGETAGLDPFGSLMIKTGHGEVVTVTAGDVETLRPLPADDPSDR